ncbi:MAG: flagellar FliJ family protein [Acidimicrobiales bacterium]
MKAYRFRLEGVLRVREVREQLAAHALAGATRQLGQAESALDRSRRALDELEPPSGQVTLGEVEWVRDQAERMAEELAARAEAVDAASRLVGEARSSWQSARTQCAVLERLDARQRAVWQEDLARAEAKEIDDLAALRYARGGAAR